MTTSSSSKLQTSDGKLAAGLQQSQANLPALMILGKTYTVAVAVTVLQQRIALRSASTSARAAWQAAMKAEAEETANKAFVAALVQQIRVWFANAPDALAAYDLRCPALRAKPIEPLAVETDPLHGQHLLRAFQQRFPTSGTESSEQVQCLGVQVPKERERATYRPCVSAQEPTCPATGKR
jgi:hypothetical protein